MKTIVTLFSIIFLLSACSPSAQAIQTAIAQTQAAMPTSTPLPQPTQVPTMQVNTGNIGDDVNCGNYFTVKVLEPPESRNVIDYYHASGIYLILKVELTSHMSETIQLRPYSEYSNGSPQIFSVEGNVSGRTLQFHDDTSAEIPLAKNDWRYWFGVGGDPLPPSVPYKVMLAFDVNPSATNWAFVFSPSFQDASNNCEAIISLERSGASQSTTPISQTATNSPSASLLSNTKISECSWDVRVSLSGFAPNSLITVSSSYTEVVCATGQTVSSSWTDVYLTKTDQSGNLVTAFNHTGTGSYNYGFVDSMGNRASLQFTTFP